MLDNVLVGIIQRYSGTYRSGSLFSASGMATPKSLRDEAREILTMFGLSDVAYQESSTLPFGLLRLLDIGRAIATRPSLLLLDEPAAGLSRSETAKLSELIAEIGSGGCGVLLIDHDTPIRVRTLRERDGDGCRDCYRFRSAAGDRERRERPRRVSIGGGSRKMISVLIIGTALGCVYALVAIGYSLVYRTTSIVNFAQGAFVMLGGMLAWWLFQLGLPYWLAALGGVVVSAFVGFLVYVPLVLPLWRQRGQLPSVCFWPR